MAVEIATAYVSIIPSARGFGRNLSNELDGQMTSAGASAGQHASLSFGKALTAGIALASVAAATGLAALGKAAAGYGLKIASQNEQASVSFETLLGSAEAASVMINDLKRFAAETPFEFPELQQAANTLLTTGVAADKIIPIMRTLGDVTSGMGTGAEGVQRAMVALQQMNAAGRILAEDLNQLRDAGIPVFDLLAGATGRTKDELSAMAQSGKLGRKELEQLMAALETGKGLEKFTGLMEKQSKTLNGMISTLKDNLGQGLAEAMAPAVVAIKAQLPGISDEIKRGLVVLGPILTDVTAQLISVVGRLVPAITPVLDVFGRGFAEVLRGVIPIVEHLLPFIAQLAAIFADELLGALADLMPEIGGLLRALSPLGTVVTRLAVTAISALAPALSALLRAVTPLAAALATGLARAFDQLDKMDLGGLFEQLTPIFVTVVDALMPLVDVFLVFANEVGAAIVDMLPSLITGFIGLSTAFLPMLPDITRLVQDLLPLMVDLFREIAPSLIRFLDAAIPLWDIMFRLKLIWGDMLLRILIPFLPLILELAEVALPLLEKIITPIVETMTHWVGVLSESTAGMALLIGLLTVGIGFKLIAQLVISIIQGYNLLTVLTLVNAAYTGVAAAQSEAAAAAALGQSVTMWGQVKTGILAAAKSSFIFKAAMFALNIVMSPWFFIPVLIAAIGAAFIIAYKDVQPFHDAVDALWAAFQRGLDVVKELIGLLFAGDFTRAGEIVSDMGGKITDSLANLGNTIKDKVGEWAASALEGLKTFGGVILNFLTSTVLPLIGNAIVGYGKLWILYITKWIPFVVTGLMRIYAALAVWLYTTVIPWLISAGRELIVSFVGWIKEAVPAALEQLGAWLQALGAWFTDTAVPWLTETASALGAAAISWVAEMVPQALLWLGKLLLSFAAWYYGTAIPWLIENGIKLLGAILGWLVDVVPTAVMWLGKLLIAFGVWYYGTAVPWLLNAGLALAGAFLHFIQELPGWLADGLTWVISSLPGWIATAATWIAEKASALGSALWGWIQEAVPGLLEKLGGLLEPIGAWITGTALPEIGKKAGELASGFVAWAAEIGPQILPKLGEMLKNIGVWIAEEAIPTLISKGSSLLFTMLLWAVKLAVELPVYLAVVLLKISEWIQAAAAWLLIKARDLLWALLEWGYRLPSTIFGLLTSAQDKIREWVVALVPWLIEKGLALFEAIVQWIKDAAVALPGIMLGFLAAVLNFITDAIPWVVEKALELKDAILGWIRDAIDAAPGILAGWGDAILNFIKELPEKITNAGKGLFTGIANAFIAAVNWIIRTWNSLEFTVPEITIFDKKIGGFTLGSNDLPEMASIESFARGGRPSVGKLSLVGEAGPELFVPDRAGTIVPNDALAAAPAAASGLMIGKVEVSGQERPTDTAFALRSELRWLALTAGVA